MAKKEVKNESDLIEVKNESDLALTMPDGTTIEAGKSDTIEVAGGKNHGVLKQWIAKGVIEVK